MSIEIPLFPLQNVLFPGAPIHVHVFEPRYKSLVADCLTRQGPFGVVLIRHGEAAHGNLAQPHRIGCTARIAQVDTLPHGRLSLLAVGDKRFRILKLRYDRPYLVGEVALLPLPPSDPGAVARADHRLRYWVSRYLEVLAQASETEVDLDPAQLPDDPTALGFTAASLLPLPAQSKQTLLSARQQIELLNEACQHYRRELPIIETMIAQRAMAQVGPFSRN